MLAQAQVFKLAGIDAQDGHGNPVWVSKIYGILGRVWRKVSELRLSQERDKDFGGLASAPHLPGLGWQYSL